MFVDIGEEVALIEGLALITGRQAASQTRPGGAAARPPNMLGRKSGAGGSQTAESGCRAWRAGQKMGRRSGAGKQDQPGRITEIADSGPGPRSRARETVVPLMPGQPGLSGAAGKPIGALGAAGNCLGKGNAVDFGRPDVPREEPGRLTARAPGREKPRPQLGARQLQAARLDPKRGPEFGDGRNVGRHLNHARFPR